MKLHDVDIDAIVDLIRAVDRDKGVNLLTTSIKTAYLVGWLAGSQSATKTMDGVFEREQLANAETQGTG